MTTDTNFVATGPADVGLQVTGNIKVGVEATGASSAGSFHLPASTIAGPSAVIADNPLCNARLCTIGRHLPTRELFGIAVFGKSDKGTGISGESDSGTAVGAQSNSGDGIFASSFSGRGVQGQSGTGPGIWGQTDSGVGVVGVATSGGLAGRFEGDVEVTGNINCHERSTITCFDVSLIGGDCAEDFDVSGVENVEPGTVMVLSETGELHECNEGYDKRVVGVVSGAGDYKPGIVLDRQGSAENRKPIALLGKVFCKVDAQYGVIDVGDLLTTSPTSGHAMRAGNPLRAFGAVIGKALHPFAKGQGLIPILIALQ
jgi:hypothetical protein